MIIEDRNKHELNLESIDKDLRMENVRLCAKKLGWEHFSRSVRRNLLERRRTLETRIRLDVLSSLIFMKEHMPIENDANIYRKIQQLAEGFGEHCTLAAHNGGCYIKHTDVTIDFGIAEENVISCKIGYFGQPLFDAPEALSLVRAGEFSKLRDSIVGMLSSLPKEVTMTDKNACKDAFRALEHVLIRDAADSSFTAINTSKYGFYSPRTDLLPGRIYFVADPMLMKLAESDGLSHPDSSYLDILPYFEISFVKHNKKCKLPTFNQSGEWATFVEANVCICLKFNRGFLFSQHTLRKLAPNVPKSPLVRGYVNFYRYLCGHKATKENMKLLTQFPENTSIQQQYDVDAQKLKKEDDAIVVDMFIADLRDLPKLIEILRSEWMHASLWESILAMCEPKQDALPKEVQAAKLQMVLRRNDINLQFDTEYGNMSMSIIEQSPSHYSVKTISQLTGDSCAELDSLLTQTLNSTWNIPITLSFGLSNLNCHLNNVLSPLNCANSSSAFDSDKLQHYLLAPKTMHLENSKTGKKNNHLLLLELGPAIRPTELVYKRENDEEHGSLLSSFGEVDPYYVETSTIGKTRSQPRPKREPNQLTSMDMMSAELDMDKGRHTSEHSMHGMRPQDAQRMSFLESARVHMKQSIGAAHAVGLASHQPLPPPGGPIRHNSYTMGYDSPMPYDPSIPASIQFPDPLAFGKGKPRKGRAKKQPGEDGVAPSGRGRGRKGRGASAVGAAGGRKSTGIGENPFAMDQMRPPLQRSFSDFPGQMNPQHMSFQQMQQMQQYQQNQQYQQSQQFQQSHQYRMQMQQHQMAQHQMQSPPHIGMNTPKSQMMPSYTDDDSEDECDPPPPPKPLVNMPPRSSVPSQQQLGNPMVGYPGMPLQSPNHLPLTPSPLSAPPKPFSPEQQHFGMKMRENAYWKELDRLDVKPDLEKLKQQMAASSTAASTSSEAIASTSTTEKISGDSSNTPDIVADAAKPPPPINKPPISAPTPKKKLGLEAAISKIRGQQEQALQKQQQQRTQQQGSVDSLQPEQPTPQPVEPNATVPPLLTPQQINRARNSTGVFDDEAEDASSMAADVKPTPSVLQRILTPSLDSSLGSIASSSETTAPPFTSTANLKKEATDIEPEREKEKLILKIPKVLKPDDRREDRKEERKEKDRDRDRDGDRERDRERSEKTKEDKAQREKDKKDRERERRRQRDRERAEQKRVEREKDSVPGKEKESLSSSSSKKRKIEKKDEKDRREPDRKKGKLDGADYNKTAAATMPTNFSLKNFRIPKKDTAEEEKKDTKDDAITPGPSSEPSRKETLAAPISRKESTTATSSVPPLQRKESFTSQIPQSEHHRDSSKKKQPPPPIGQPSGTYQGAPNMGPLTNSSRVGNSGPGNRKQPMPPPPQMMRGPPPDQMYRERAGSMRGFPPSSHYHGSGGSGGSKQVASYAQGLPPGMGPPAVKPHGNNYQASQWVRPPTHRDSHSYHGMPSLGPPQVQREPPPPPPQMIPLPREPLPRETLPRDPPAREHPRERGSRGGNVDGGPDSPEEGTLRIDDE